MNLDYELFQAALPEIVQQVEQADDSLLSRTRSAFQAESQVEPIGRLVRLLWEAHTLNRSDTALFAAAALAYGCFEAGWKARDGLVQVEEMVEAVGGDESHLTRHESSAVLRAALSALGKGVRIGSGQLESYANRGLLIAREEGRLSVKLSE